MSLFKFKQFVVQQDNCAMKVGTDGVLLGAWAAAKEGNILDVGTGTGLIALMLAQRTKTSNIYGIEIDPLAAQQAKDNIALSPWKDRIKVIQGDVFQIDIPFIFDEIVSNPPFYIDSPSSSSKQRDVARKAVPSFYTNLIDFVCHHLSDNGIFEVVLPVEYKDSFVYKCWEKNIFLKHQTILFTKAGKQPKRVLLCFSSKNGMIQKDELSITNLNGEFSDEYKKLTEDFYLKI